MSEAVETLVDRVLEGKAPLNLRSAAARGAVPLARADLARLFVLLLKDEEEIIRQDAANSLQAMEPGAVREVLADRGCAPEVLNYFAKRALRDERMAELIVFHDRLPEQALDLLASKGSAKVIELVLTNQERLLSQPGLLDKLTVNPALRADQRGRILELLDRISKLIAARGEAEGGETESDTAEQAIAAEEAARILDVDVGELFAASEILGGEELEQAEDPVIRSTYAKIVTLNTAQKAILAMKGGREERMILIRDTNKVVSLSVLKNPRITENDVEQIAMMRNVSAEVLRSLGSKRNWIKSYSVVKTLVHNPKTPPGIGTNFVSRLQTRDLKNLSRDRNVPEIIRRMAKRIIDTRTIQRAKVSRR